MIIVIAEYHFNILFTLFVLLVATANTWFSELNLIYV